MAANRCNHDLALIGWVGTNELVVPLFQCTKCLVECRGWFSHHPAPGVLYYTGEIRISCDIASGLTFHRWPAL